MHILEREDRRVEAAVLYDALNEGGELVFCDERAAIARCGKWTKCAALGVEDIKRCKAQGLLNGNVCYIGVPFEAKEYLGGVDKPCRSYAYLDRMPPVVDASDTVKRLAPSLAETVKKAYCGEDDGYDTGEIAELMRTKGVFGVVENGKLAGFIGRHFDGSMGMLEVFEPFRRHGIGERLEKFLIGYVMTFMRIPTATCIWIIRRLSLCRRNSA